MKLSMKRTAENYVHLENKLGVEMSYLPLCFFEGDYEVWKIDYWLSLMSAFAKLLMELFLDSPQYLCIERSFNNVEFFVNIYALKVGKIPLEISNGINTLEINDQWVPGNKIDPWSPDPEPATLLKRLHHLFLGTIKHGAILDWSISLFISDTRTIQYIALPEVLRHRKL